jgi:pilus assembly protein Flp/PilA
VPERPLSGTGSAVRLRCRLNTLRNVHLAKKTQRGKATAGAASVELISTHGGTHMSKTTLAEMARHFAKKLHLDQAGATAVEYGLMVALIAAVIIGAVTALGTSTSEKFDVVEDAISGAGGGGEETGN